LRESAFSGVIFHCCPRPRPPDLERRERHVLSTSRGPRGRLAQTLDGGGVGHSAALAHGLQTSVPRLFPAFPSPAGRPQDLRAMPIPANDSPTHLRRSSAAQTRLPKRASTNKHPGRSSRSTTTYKPANSWVGDRGGAAGDCGVQAAGGGGVATRTARRRRWPTQEYADIAYTASRIGPSDQTEISPSIARAHRPSPVSLWPRPPTRMRS
jgi:hypothetical protein